MCKILEVVQIQKQYLQVCLSINFTQKSKNLIKSMRKLSVWAFIVENDEKCSTEFLNLEFKIESCDSSYLFE